MKIGTLAVMAMNTARQRQKTFTRCNGVKQRKMYLKCFICPAKSIICRTLEFWQLDVLIMNNNISECTTRRTLKQMGYSSRRPQRVPLLSAKNRKRRLQFAQAHQNWTIEDWKNIAWSDDSRFLLRHSDGRVRIWLNEHESMDPS